MFQSNLKYLTVSVVFLFLVQLVHGGQKLDVKIKWKTIDFNFTDENARAAAKNTLQYIPENVIPVGMDVYKDRIFLTFPRLKRGVPASLGYIKTSGKFLINSVK